MAQNSQTFTGNGTWTAPSNLVNYNKVVVEAIGAGGAGGSNNKTTSADGGAGGGGGAYARNNNVTVVRGVGYAVVVGTLGAYGASNNSNGSNGTSSTFNTTTVVAQPGLGGNRNGVAPTAYGTRGAGGNAGNSTGEVTYYGGNGAADPGTTGEGGGGGSAGWNSTNGNPGSGSTGGTGSGDSGSGGQGGAGGSNANGNVGGDYGGGGGGSGNGNASTKRGGNGAGGWVKVTWEEGAVNVITNTADGIVVTKATKTNTANAIIQATGEKTFTVDAKIVYGVYTKSYTSDGIILARTAKTITANAHFTHQGFQSQVYSNFSSVQTSNFTSANNMKVDDNAYATSQNAATARMYNWAQTTPIGDTVLGIQVIVHAWSDTASSGNYYNVDISWDGGTSWTTAKQAFSSGLTTSEQTSVVGSDSDTWGRAWTVAEIANTANFQVRLTAVQGSGTYSYVDWAAWRVFTSFSGANWTTYTQISTDTDDGTEEQIVGTSNTWYSNVTNNVAGYYYSAPTTYYYLWGMAFRGVIIPPGAIIESAKIAFYSYLSQTYTVNFKIFGVDQDDFGNFGQSPNLPSEYYTSYATAAQIDWDLTGTDSWTDKTMYYTPELSTIIQEIVDRGGWANGNDIGIIVKDDGGTDTREFYDYTAGSTYGAYLLLEYALVKTNTADAIITEETGTKTKSQTADGIILGTSTKTHTSDGYVATRTTKTNTADGIIISSPMVMHVVTGTSTLSVTVETGEALVFVAGTHQGDITSVAFNGDAGTEVCAANTAFNETVHIFYWETPDVGTYDLTWSASGTGDRGCALVISGQASGQPVSYNTEGDDHWLFQTAPANNILYIGGSYGEAALTMATDQGLVERDNYTGSSYENFACATSQNSEGLVRFYWTQSSGQRNAVATIAIKAPSSGTFPISHDSLTNGNFVSSAASETVTHTVGASLSNSILVVSVGLRGATQANLTVTGVTWNGTENLTNLRSDIWNVSTYVRGEIWYLVNPTAGTHDVVVTATGTCEYINVYVESWYGVDPTTPFETNTGSGTKSSTATSVSTNVTTSSSNTVVIDSVWTKDDALNWVVGQGNFPVTAGLPEHIGTDYHAVSFKRRAEAGSTSMGWTWTNSEGYTHSIGVLKGSSFNKKTFTADGIILGTTAKTFTVDAIISAELSTYTKTNTADGLVLETFVKTNTADGIIKEILVKTATSDGVIAGRTVKTNTVDGIIRETFVQSYTVDALVRAAGFKTITADGIVKVSSSKTDTTDAIIQSSGYIGRSIDWYNSSWSYRVRITVKASKVDVDLTNYPVYVNLAHLPAAFHTHVNQTDARDIRVTKADGVTELAREVVWYTAASDTGELHFKADFISSDIDTVFYIYYGNSGASDYGVTDTYGRNNVWTAYSGVWHLHESGTGAAGEYKDSTGTNNGQGGAGDAGKTPTATAFKIGNGQDFAPANTDYITLGTPTTWNNLTQFTIESWVNLDTATANSDIVRNLRDTGGGIGLQSVDTGSRFQAMLASTSAAQYKKTTSASYTTGVDYHVVATWKYADEPSGMHIYVNGVDKALTTSWDGGPTNTGNNPNTMLFAAQPNPSTPNFDGKIDEIRISSTAFSSTWVSTTYNNQSSPSTFYDVSSEQGSFTADGIIKVSSVKTNTADGIVLVTSLYRNGGLCLLDKTNNNNDLTNYGADVSTDVPSATNWRSASLVLANSDYLTADDSTSLSITGNMTIELWTKFTNLPGSGGNYTFVAKDNLSTMRSYDFFFMNTAGTYYLDAVAVQGANHVYYRCAWTPEVDTWYHVALTITPTNPSSTTFEFFVNGNSMGNGTYWSGAGITAISDTDAKLSIGRFTDSSSGYHNGKLDDIRIWNDIRTQEEISNNYRSRLLGNEDGLVFLQTFDFDEGLTIDGIIKETLVQTNTADGLITAGGEKTFSVDGIILVTSIKTFTADGIITEKKVVSITVDGVVKTIETKTITVDGIILVVGVKSNTADGIISLTSVKTNTVDGIIKETLIQSNTADGFINAGGFKLLTIDGIISETKYATYTIDGGIIPEWARYSRGNYQYLPTDNSTLENPFTPDEYADVESHDYVYVNQAATGQASVFMFKWQNINNTQTITFDWTGKTDKAPSASPVYLQVYRQSTGDWLTLDDDSATGAGTEFSLQGQVLDDVENYYDASNWVAFRVYQVAF